MRYHLLCACVLCSILSGCALFHPQPKTAAPKITIRQVTKSMWVTSEGVMFTRFVETKCVNMLECLPPFAGGVELSPTLKFTPPLPQN